MEQESNYLTSSAPFKTKQPPKFVRIKDLTPTSSGFSLIGKMIFSKKILDRLHVDGTRKRLVECLIGDNTGCVMLTLKNEQIEEIKIGEVLILRNARVHMLSRGYLRVVVDKWGAIDRVPGSSMSADINFECNKSDVEYTLQAQNEDGRVSRRRGNLNNRNHDAKSKEESVVKQPSIRKLHPYEVFLTYVNVTTCILIKGKLTKDDVANAYRFARMEHPYLRMGIRKLKDGGQEFVEVAPNKDDAVPLKHTIVTDEKEFEREEFWTEALDKAANGSYDHETSMCFLELFSNPKMTKHCLIGVVNHAHMDARGNFALYESILDYLGQIVDYQTIMKGHMKNPFAFISVRCRRPFIDIINQILTNYKKDPDRYSIPKLHENFMQPLPSKTKESIKSDAIAKISFHLFEWNTEHTQQLRLACRNHSVTIQDVFSAACIIAVCHLQRFESRDPVNVRLIVPCQMSSRVSPPVNDHDCVCGAAALVFEVPISVETLLWELAQNCHKALQESMESGCTFEWMAAINGVAVHPSGEKVSLPKVTTMCSSVGVNHMRANYGGIEITGVKMVGAAYKGNVSPTHASTMAHAHTFDGRLNVSIEYNSPGLSEDESSRYCSVYQGVLKNFLRPDSEHPLNIGEILKKFESR